MYSKSRIPTKLLYRGGGHHGKKRFFLFFLQSVTRTITLQKNAHAPIL